MLSATTVIKTGQTNIGWHNVLDKGAVGDGTTDNTTAFRANEHDIAVAGSGVFFVPAGHFLVSDSIPIPVTTTIFGMGGIAEQSDSTTSGKITRYAVSTILINTGAKNCFVINASGFQAEGISVVGTSSTTPTSCHAFLFNNAVGMRMNNCSAYYCYEGVHITNSKAINT